MTDMTVEQELEVKVEKLVVELENFKKKFQQKSRKTFHKLFKAFWKQHPNVKAVGWCQYTPYFNDGEPCEFGVHDKHILTPIGYRAAIDDGAKGWNLEGFSPYDWEGKLQKNETISLEEYESAKRFLKYFSRISDDTYYDLFGDHVSIIATRKGFEVSEYDHD